MDFNKIKEYDKEYIANTYNRFDVDVDTADGVYFSNAQGDSFIDFSSGIGVNSLGFGNENWKKAVKDQIDNLNHISNLYYTQPQVKLAKKLAEKTGMKKVFFANSGAEANEGAIKTARKYSSDKYGANRYEIITLVNSFHGRTLATLSATGQDVFHKDFGPFVDGFLYAHANDIDNLKNLISKNTAAIMIECIQGEGGVIPLEKDFVNYIDKICKENDILLIVDEVQTGVGRTGKFLASEHYGLLPDIVTLAKGLGGGLPIGAVLFGDKTKDTLTYGDHGTTFGGNPIACAGALAVLESIDQDFLNDITEKSNWSFNELKSLPNVKTVSGKGLMIGIELEDYINASDIAKKCANKGLILLTAKNKLRLLPPLNITEQQLAEGINILKEVLQ